MSKLRPREAMNLPESHRAEGHTPKSLYLLLPAASLGPGGPEGWEGVGLIPGKPGGHCLPDARLPFLYSLPGAEAGTVPGMEGLNSPPRAHPQCELRI